jgi:MFS family permease
MLFAALYFSEGAPIGFIWWALPAQLRLQHVPIEQITLLTSTLVLPWTLKFLWAPLVDLLSGNRWTLSITRPLFPSSAFVCFFTPSRRQHRM